MSLIYRDWDIKIYTLKLTVEGTVQGSKNRWLYACFVLLSTEK